MELFMELSGLGERESCGGSAATIDRERRIQAALRAYENSPWGSSRGNHDQAAGLCKRASLVLLELLNREGIEDAELWHLGMPKEGGGFAPSDEHYVVVIGAEAIDATARQFDETSDPITRRSLKEVEKPRPLREQTPFGEIGPTARSLTQRRTISSGAWRTLAHARGPRPPVARPRPRQNGGAGAAASGAARF